jgi:hypothetical protein
LFSRALAAVLFASLMLAAACGSTSTSTPATTHTTPATAAASTRFCGAAGNLVKALSGGRDPSTALTAAIDSAPKSVGEHLATMGEKMGAAAASGDDAAFLADDVRAIARTALGEIASTCHYQTADTTAVEYTFKGLPATLAAGPTAFRMTNAGSQVHEMLVYRRAKGTKGNLIEIVNDDPTVTDGRLKEVGVMIPAAPGENSVLLADLTPGDYVAVCFLPEGTTTIAQVGAGNGKHTGRDHRSLGMIKPFTVD